MVFPLNVSLLLQKPSSLLPFSSVPDYYHNLHFSSTFSLSTTEMSTLSSIEWQEEYRRERGAIDTRWQAVKDEIKRLRLQWEEVRVAEARLEEDRTAFEGQRQEVILNLSQERSKLMQEADSLTERSIKVKEKEAEVLLLKRTVSGIAERNLEHEAELKQQERRLHERELLLNTLIQRLKQQDVQQNEAFLRLQKDFTPTPEFSLAQLKELKRKVDRRDVRLTAREKVLSQNEDAFRRIVREAGGSNINNSNSIGNGNGGGGGGTNDTRHSDEFASLLRSADVAPHLSSSELSLYNHSTHTSPAQRSTTPPHSSHKAQHSPGSTQLNPHCESPVIFPVNFCLSPDTPDGVEGEVEHGSGGVGVLSPTPPEVSAADATLLEGGGGGVGEEACSVLLDMESNPLLQSMLMSELAASQQRVSEMAARMSDG